MLPYRTLEALSFHLSAKVTYITCSGHTFRMLVLQVGSSVIDVETTPQDVAKKVLGYLWGRVVLCDDALAFGAFHYRLEHREDSMVVELQLNCEVEPLDSVITSVKLQEPAQANLRKLLDPELDIANALDDL